MKGCAYLSPNQAEVKSRRRGFILAAAIAVCLAMVVISLVVANQNRALVGFARNTHAEAQQAETAQYGLSQLQGYLNGQGPMTRVFKTSPPDPGASNYTHPGESPDGSVVLAYKITHRPPGNVTEAHSFTGPAQQGSGVDFNVPPGHSSALLTNTLKADKTAGTNKFFAMYSSNFPFALLSQNGLVRAQSVRSVSNASASNTIPLMAHVYGSSSVNVSGRMNGRAYSSGPVALGPAGGSGPPQGSGGIPQPQYPTRFTIPQDFQASVNGFKANVPVGAGVQLQTALQAAYDAQHRHFLQFDAPQTLQHNVGTGIPTPPALTSLGGQSEEQSVVDKASVADLNISGGSVELDAILRIPSGNKQSISFSRVNPKRGLYLEQGSCLHVVGSLETTSIWMGRYSTLFVTGDLSAQRVALTYAPTDEPVSSTVMAGGSLSLADGTGMQNPGTFVGLNPSKASFPFPERIAVNFYVPPPPPPGSYHIENDPSDILTNAFNLQFEADRAALTAAEFSKFVGTVSPPSGVETTNVPGALLVAGTALTSGGTRTAGLLNANTITINSPSFVGAAWAGGDITVRDVFFYPYFTRAFGFTGSQNVSLGARNTHPIGYGKVP